MALLIANIFTSCSPPWTFPSLRSHPSSQFLTNLRQPASPPGYTDTDQSTGTISTLLYPDLSSISSIIGKCPHPPQLSRKYHTKYCYLAFSRLPVPLLLHLLGHLAQPHPTTHNKCSLLPSLRREQICKVVQH